MVTSLWQLVFSLMKELRSPVKTLLLQNHLKKRGVLLTKKY